MLWIHVWLSVGFISIFSVQGGKNGISCRIQPDSEITILVTALTKP